LTERKSPCPPTEVSWCGQGLASFLAVAVKK
jgi:hypothetical protein